MEQKLTREQVASIAARVLINIYGQDMKAVAKIMKAQAEVREGNPEGYYTLADALTGARDFIQGLINNIIIDDKQKG